MEEDLTYHQENKFTPKELKDCPECEIDELIRYTQLNTTQACDYLEWIPFENFELVKYVVSARISDVGLYEPCNYDKSRSQLYGSYHMLRRNFYVAKIKVLPLTWIQDNDPGKRPTASYLNENLEEWIILICDDPNPSKISGKNSILLSGIFGTTSIVMNLCQYLDHHNLLIVSKDARIGDMDHVTMMEAYWYTKKWSLVSFQYMGCESP
ncbi:11806_t:CDS:2 [Rhizophagus irregularis]|nr:11806_t:CDS:2 [Rhizophagus irregularis]